MVRIPGFHHHGLGSTPGQGTKILQAVQHSQKEEKVENYISSSDFRNMILFIQCSMRSK